MKRRADGRFQKKIRIDGRQVVLYSRAASEREAVRDFNNQILNLENKERSKLLFEKVADEWVTDYIEKVPEATYRKGGHSAYCRALDFFSGTNITDITPGDVNTYILHLSHLGYSKKSVANFKCILNLIMQHALLAGYIKINPCAGLHIPPGLPANRRPLPSSDELRICAEHFEGFDFLPFFLLHTGCRISEALALTFDDIDRKTKTARINKHLIHISNQPILENVTKTKNAERSVLLLDRVLEHLPKGSGSDLIFCNAEGGPYTRRQFRTQWKNYSQRYGVTFTPHQLRHGYATILYEAGIQERDAMELMGHSDITLTRQIYTHIRSERKAETLQRLNDFSL